MYFAWLTNLEIRLKCFVLNERPLSTNFESKQFSSNPQRIVSIDCVLKLQFSILSSNKLYGISRLNSLAILSAASSLIRVYRKTTKFTRSYYSIPSII